jgi:hypothetical protein
MTLPNSTYTPPVAFRKFYELDQKERLAAQLLQASEIVFSLSSTSVRDWHKIIDTDLIADWQMLAYSGEFGMQPTQKQLESLMDTVIYGIKKETMLKVSKKEYPADLNLTQIYETQFKRPVVVTRQSD